MNVNSRPAVTNLTEKNKIDLIRQLTSHTGFDAMFYQMLGDPEIRTQAEAFDKLCDLYREVVSREPNYKNFESYRVARDRRMKRRK